MHHLQQAIRRKLFALIVLALLCIAVLVLAPGSGSLPVVAIVGAVIAIGLIVVAFLPLGGARGGATTTAPDAAAGPQSAAPPQQGFAPPQHGQAPEHRTQLPGDEIPPAPGPR